MKTLRTCLLLFLAASFSGCLAPTIAAPTATVPVILNTPEPSPALGDLLPTVTPTPFQPLPPTPVPPTPVPPPQLWLSPEVPAGLQADLHPPAEVKYTAQPAGGDLRLVAAPPGPVSQDVIQVSSWVYALVAPFPTLLDGVSQTDLLSRWRGENNGPLAARPFFMETSTLAAFTALWGSPGKDAIQVLPGEQLLETAWADRPAWAIVPFEMLQPRWKVLAVNGQNPLQKAFDPAAYPLTVQFNLLAPAAGGAAGDLLKSGSWAPATNRDPSRLTVVIMTGTTALVRAIAYKMEINSVTYPARDIRDWLHTGDLVHTSNEVSFYNKCPYPDPISTQMLFCSLPKYVGLFPDAGINILELTGNHNNDVAIRFDTDVYQSTLDLFRKNGLQYYAGGVNLSEARKPLLIEHNGNRVAFLGCNLAGPAYAWAKEDAPGAAPCGDYGWLVAEIARLRQEGYLPIVTLQYYEDYTNRPNFQMKEDAQRLIDAGAVVVDGSQAHTPKGMDFYKGGFIHYGLGNLFFDQMAVPIGGTVVTSVRQEFLDRHTIYNGRVIGTELLTARLEDFARPRPMTAAERLAFLEEIFKTTSWH